MLLDVIDPEMEVNVVDMGLIYDIDIIDEKVKIDMTLTNAACPQGPEMIAEIKKIIKSLNGVSDVEVNLVWKPLWNPDMMSEDAKEMLAAYFPGFKID